MRFAEIYLNQTNKRIDHPYDYKIPERFEPVVVPGVRVGVTFGNGNRQLEGFVVRVKKETAYPDKIKELEAVIDESPILTKEQIALCLWMKSTYCSLFYEGLYHFTSPVKVVRRLVISEENPHENRIAFEPYESTEKVYRLEQKFSSCLRQGISPEERSVSCWEMLAAAFAPLRRRDWFLPMNGIQAVRR